MQGIIIYLMLTRLSGIKGPGHPYIWASYWLNNIFII
jgi:hypothetical protein